MSQVVLSMCLDTWKPKGGDYKFHLKGQSLNGLYIFYSSINLF